MHNALPLTNLDAKYFTTRLMQRLAVIRTHPLTVIEAPMGYGKTLAAREYMRASSLPCIWTSVQGNGENAFWRDFCRALREQFPNSADIVESLSRLGYPSDSVLVDAARELILSLPVERETILVIDDYHLLPDRKPGSADGGMGRLCKLLARQGQENLHMVLLSRDAYTGEREILELKGTLAIIPQSAFAFTPREIHEYYALCGFIVNRVQAENLFKATSGWISALYLYLVRYSKHGILSRPVALSAMIKEGVYASLPEPVKDLLFAVYPAEQFSLNQADFLRKNSAWEEGGGSDETAALLHELQAKNSFLSFEESNATYALHSIFREFLADRFAELPLERRNAVHSRCADWYERNCDAFSAIKACRLAGDFERALTVLEADMSRNFVTENAAFFLDFFKTCPGEDLARHIPAAFKYAIAAFSTGDFQTFGAQIEWLSRQCAAKPEDDAAANAMRGELELLYSLMAFNDIEAMSRHHRRANELLGRPTRLYSHESPWTLGSPSVLFMFYRQSGRLAEAVRLMHECLPHYYTLTNGHGSGGEHMMEAEALYNAGDFDSAAIACHRAKAMAAANSQLGNVFCALFLQLRLALVAGDFSLAEAQLREMRGMIREKRDYFMLHTADMCEGFLYATLGQIEFIPEWLKSAEKKEKLLYTFAGGFYYIVYGRALLVAGHYAELIGLFAWLLEVGVFSKNLLFTIYGRTFMAGAFHAMGKRKEALIELEQAFSLALPDGMIMPFVENFDTVGPLFRSVTQSPVFKSGMLHIRTLAEEWDNTKRIIYSQHFPLGDISLTRRETQMALLAAQRKTYPEIAKDLHIAATTVKKAFSVMFRKLGVSGRDELIALLARKGGYVSTHLTYKKSKNTP